MKQLRRTVCNRDCPDACGLVATVENGQVTQLSGDREHPITRGFLCYRTSRFLEVQSSKERLTSPLVRKGGRLVEANWDEALELVASTFLRIRSESGPAAIFRYRSGGSLGLLHGLGDLLFDAFGPVSVHQGSICNGAGAAAQRLDFGVCDSSDLLDLLNARQILVWGKNTHVSSPHTLRVLLEARKKGARLLLVDPVRHRGAEVCEGHVQLAPGGDFALAMAAAQVLFNRGWEDPQASRYCENLEGFVALARSRSVEQWCREADVEPSAAEQIAWRLGPGKPCTILVGWGLGRRTGGGATLRALDALGAVSGNLGIPGGGVSFYFARRAAFDTSIYQSGKPAPRALREICLGQELEEASAPPVRAAWISCANPVAMLPESSRTARALASRELTVVLDSFLTDTARCAHVVLPTPTLLEADDLLGSYGHHWLGMATPVVPPPPGVKSDLEILQALAQRWGLSKLLEGDARSWKARLLAAKAAPSGVSLEQLEAGPMRSPLAPPVLFADRRFLTPSGKVCLLTQEARREEPLSERYPLRLMALSTLSSQSAQWIETPKGPLEVTVHPASSAGLADGARAHLESALGSLEVLVRHDPRQRRDVALVPKGGHLALGQCANALTRGRPTDLGEGAALYEEPVRLSP